MIKSEKIGNELYVWIWERGLKKLLYKRWLDRGYGKVMGNPEHGGAFTAKDTESFNQSITDKTKQDGTN
jgi:hypothetical protein